MRRDRSKGVNSTRFDTYRQIAGQARSRSVMLLAMAAWGTFASAADASASGRCRYYQLLAILILSLY